MIKINSLCFCYDENVPIFNNFSAEMQEGERVCLKAASGRGKTTLLRLIAGLEKPCAGTIDIKNNYKISFCWQNDDLMPWYSARKNISLVSEEEEAVRLAKLFNIYESIDKKPSELSGGMKKRVSLARAVAYKPDILLIDEGFNGLDKELKFKIMDVIDAELKNTLIIFSSHSDEESSYFANRIIEF